MPIAFKEWAVTVRALAEGEQLVTLRKGGIREENKHFELEHERFFLYPTFDHQRNDLVRPSHHPELRRALEEGVWPDEEPPPRALIQDGGIPQPDRVRIRAWAEVTDHFTVTDRRVVDGLSPFYVWTPDYAEKRLNWKRRHPLHVLLLRVHRIPRPVTVRVRDEYHGCRSWVEIDRDLPFEGTPVMADEEFDRAREEIEAPLRATPSRRSPDRLSTGRSLERVLSGASKALVLGMGGGGDVVGALGTRPPLPVIRGGVRPRRRRLGALAGGPPPGAARAGRDPRRPAAELLRPCSPARGTTTPLGGRVRRVADGRVTCAPDTVLVDIGRRSAGDRRRPSRGGRAPRLRPDRPRRRRRRRPRPRRASRDSPARSATR